MAAALYNRYRPQTFAEVVGQEHVTSALISALEHGRTHHAYLFSGPRGCGKTSSARILAASLNCVHGPTPTPCGVCEQCVGIRTGSSVDVVEIDAASHGGVEDARDLRERALYVPASARYRVFVIDEAHQVSRDGFNALLKIVEEPPSYLVFVFATTEPEKVLPTIRSRTFSYQFRLVPPTALREHLARIVAAEGADIAPEVLPLVVRAGGGSVRDSLSVLDQLIAGGITTYERAAALLGVTDVVLLDEAVEALPARDGAALFGVVERVVAAGLDPRSFARDLLERLRDLLLLRAVPEASERGLVDGVPPDQLDRMRHQAASLGGAELSRAADVVAAGLVEMRGTTSPRLQLELLCARLLLPAVNDSAGSLAARLDAVERRLTLSPAAADPGGAPPRAPARQAAAGPGDLSAPAVAAATSGADSPAAAPAPAPPTPAEVSAPAVAPATYGADRSAGPSGSDSPGGGIAGTQAPAPQAVPAPEPGAVDAARLRESWPLVLDAVKKRSRVPYVVLAEHAQIADVAGDVVTIAITLPPIARSFQGGSGPDVLADALGEVVGGSWRIQVSVGGPAAGPVPDSRGPLGSQPPPAPTGGAASSTASGGGRSGVSADFAPGDGPADESDAAADPAAAPVREVDPVDFARQAFGATVISDTGQD